MAGKRREEARVRLRTWARTGAEVEVEAGLGMATYPATDTMNAVEIRPIRTRFECTRSRKPKTCLWPTPPLMCGPSASRYSAWCVPYFGASFCCNAMLTATRHTPPATRHLPHATHRTPLTAHHSPLTTHHYLTSPNVAHERAPLRNE